MLFMSVCQINVCLIWTVYVKVCYVVGIVKILLIERGGNDTAYALDGTFVWFCSILHDSVVRATPLWSN